jgi:hypothetical protein
MCPIVSGGLDGLGKLYENQSQPWETNSKNKYNPDMVSEMVFYMKRMFG